MELNREILKSSAKIRRRKIERFLSFSVLSIVALLDLSFFIAQLDFFRIKQVDISGNQIIGTSAIFETINRPLSGKYFGFYPKSNFLIYPKSDIIDSILKFSTIGEAEVAMGGSTLYVSIKEREPKYLWCGDFVSYTQDKQCYYLDENGFSYGRAPEFSDHIFFEFYGGEKLGGYTGKNILPPDQFKNVVSLYGSLETAIKQFISPDAELYGVNIKKVGDIDFLVKGDGSFWEIRSTISLDSVEQAKKMEVAVSSAVFQGELKKNTHGILYLDLRFGKKVFYKFR